VELGQREEAPVGVVDGGVGFERGEAAADGEGVLGLGLGDEPGALAGGVGLEASDLDLALLLDGGLGALDAGGDGAEEKASDLGEEAHVADEGAIDRDAPALGLAADLAEERLAEGVAVVEDRLEVTAAEDRRGGVGDEVLHRVVPVVDGEEGADRVDDAELDPEVDEDGGAAGVVDVDVGEDPEITGEGDRGCLDPREEPGRAEVGAGRAEGLGEAAEAGDQDGVLVLDLDEGRADEEDEEREEEVAGGEGEEEG